MQNFNCIDCSVDTLEIREYYMVHNDVWSQTGLPPSGGMLCVSCLETRIGRTLVPSDFSDYPINDLFQFPKSDNILSRMFYAN